MKWDVKQLSCFMVRKKVNVEGNFAHMIKLFFSHAYILLKYLEIFKDRNCTGLYDTVQDCTKLYRTVPHCKEMY